MFGDLKSGIPAETEIPAPVNITIFFGWQTFIYSDIPSISKLFKPFIRSGFLNFS